MSYYSTDFEQGLPDAPQPHWRKVGRSRWARDDGAILIHNKRGLYAFAYDVEWQYLCAHTAREAMALADQRWPV